MRLLVVVSVVFSCLMNISQATAKTVQHEMGKLTLDKTPSKIVALDWVLTESLLSLGIEPYAVANSKGYNQWVVKPTLPNHVKSVGSRREPNLEQIAALKPDLILISKHLSPVYNALQRIAPTMVLTVYNDQRDPIGQAKKVLNKIAIIINKEPVARKVIKEADQQIQQNGERLKALGKTNRPYFFVRLIGDRHIRIHGSDSLAGQTLEKIGLANAWKNDTNFWGFSSASIDKLAHQQQANVFYLKPQNDLDKQKVFSTPLWKALAFTREQRVYELPPTWVFGGLQSAVRLSHQVTSTLISTANK